MTTATLEQLSGYLGATTAEALLEWATLNGRDLHVPAHPWLRRGFTDARLAQLFISDPEHGTRLVVIKVMPGKSAEPQAHRRALLETPAAFRPHLVEQIYEPLPLAGGGAIAFQRLAGDSRDWRPMADLPSQRLGPACEVITRSLLADWNPDRTIRTARTVDFLRGEVENQGSVHSQVAPAGLSARSAWIRIDGDHPLPNPIHLLGDDSLLADEPIDLVYGRSHGDLHDLNVLIRQSRDGLLLDSFVFVDLMTYASSAQLGRDPLRLLLSVTARALPGLSDPQRALLLPAFVRPLAPAPPELPPVAMDTLQAVYRTAAQLLSPLGDDIWRRQYLLGLIAQGLMMTTYENLGPVRRWWFFLLAGHAARELLEDLDRLDEPRDAPVLSSPYAVPASRPPLALAAPRTPLALTPPPAVRPQPTYSDSRRRAVCNGLRHDWTALADRVGIPAADRTRFAPGAKPQGVWDWLADRGRLGELPAALRSLGLNRLADILET